jgi:hypothetical protein
MGFMEVAAQGVQIEARPFANGTILGDVFSGDAGSNTYRGGAGRHLLVRTRRRARHRLGHGRGGRLTPGACAGSALRQRLARMQQEARPRHGKSMPCV